MNPDFSFLAELRLPDELSWLTEQSIAGNELWRIAALAGVVLAALLTARIASGLLRLAAGRARDRGHPLVAVTLDGLARASGLALVASGFVLGMQFLHLGALSAGFVHVAQSLLWTLAIGYTGYCLIGVGDEWLRLVSARRPSRMNDMLAPLVSKMLRGTVLVLVLVQIATVLSDKPVTSVIAGLGIGGLAIGLAAQDTIKQVFGSMVIFADRPFELGDEITADGQTGVVESVGFRSTRFRTNEGHLVTIPNGQLANLTIVNISRRRNLVRKFVLQLAPGQPAEKVQQALTAVNEILADHEGLDPAHPPRVHFTELTAANLMLSVQYWYHPADRWKFLAFSERVNLEILRRFRAAGIALAGGPPPPPAAA